MKVLRYLGENVWPILTSLAMIAIAVIVYLGR